MFSMFLPLLTWNHWELKLLFSWISANWKWITWYKFKRDDHNSPWLDSLCAYCYVSQQKIYLNTQRHPQRHSKLQKMLQIWQRNLGWQLSELKTMGLQCALIIKHCFSFISVEMPLIKYLTAHTLRPNFESPPASPLPEVSN